VEFTFPLNKFEEEKKVIELHKQGKTIRQIAPEVRKSFRDISKIIKAYEKKIKLQQNKKENNQSTTKKPSLSSQAYKLFQDGKELTDVAIDLEIPAKRVLRLWSQFLRLEKMYECYEFYQVFQSQIPDILAIGRFIRINNVDTRKIANTLKETIDLNHLQSYRLEIKNEIERLKQIKNHQNMQNYALKPLPDIKWNYPYRNNYW
jgi:predicted SpoU family rRNA methylase